MLVFSIRLLKRWRSRIQRSSCTTFLILRCERERASKDAPLQCFLESSLIALSSPASVSGYMRPAKMSLIILIEWV